MTSTTFRPGSCVNCGRGTDTALALDGEAEWYIAFLTVLGIAEDEATATLRAYLDPSPPAGQVPDGRMTITVRVCAECVSQASAPFPAPALAMPGMSVPVLRQPEEVA
jgi:hypothetical protein